MHHRQLYKEKNYLYIDIIKQYNLVITVRKHYKINQSLINHILDLHYN